MESRATMKYYRCSPRKARRIVDLIRGKNVEQALMALRVLPHSAARPVERVLRSAVANAEQAQVAHPEEMVVSKVCVDGGPIMKRIMPKAQGRVNRILKRTSHISVVLSEK